jgi:hypothetical protein
VLETGTYLLLGKIIWEVCDHNLVLRWDTIGRWATLTAFTWRTSTLVILVGLLCAFLVGSVGQRKNLTGGWGAGWELSAFLALRLMKLAGATAIGI